VDKVYVLYRGALAGCYFSSLWLHLADQTL